MFLSLVLGKSLGEGVPQPSGPFVPRMSQQRVGRLLPFKAGRSGLSRWSRSRPRLPRSSRYQASVRSRLAQLFNGLPQLQSPSKIGLASQSSSSFLPPLPNFLEQILSPGADFQTVNRLGEAAVVESEETGSGLPQPGTLQHTLTLGLFKIQQGINRFARNPQSVLNEVILCFQIHLVSVARQARHRNSVNIHLPCWSGVTLCLLGQSAGLQSDIRPASR